jgi:hypothetical protein
MRVPSSDFSLANFQTAFDGIDAGGLAGSYLNVTSNQSQSINTILGTGPSTTNGSGAGGYSGGQSPGNGPPGGSSDSTGDNYGDSSSGFVGGQDPGSLYLGDPPPDQDDSYDEFFEYVLYSGVGGTATHQVYDGMPGGYVNSNQPPHLEPHTYLGCIPCMMKAFLNSL